MGDIKHTEDVNDRKHTEDVGDDKRMREWAMSHTCTESILDQFFPFQNTSHLITVSV